MKAKKLVHVLLLVSGTFMFSGCDMSSLTQLPLDFLKNFTGMGGSSSSTLPQQSVNVTINNNPTITSSPTVTSSPSVTSSPTTSLTNEPNAPITLTFQPNNTNESTSSPTTTLTNTSNPLMTLTNTSNPATTLNTGNSNTIH